MTQQDGAGREIGLTGARLGGARRRRGRSGWSEDTATMALPAVAEPPSAAEPGPPAPVARLEPRRSAPDPSSSLAVRPYVLTRGRTRSRVELAIETLVSAVPAATAEPAADPGIVELCRVPRSVAEVAALRGLPLGVAKVLLGDLALAGVITVHRTVAASGPDLALMERVLGGLRRL